MKPFIWLGISAVGFTVLAFAIDQPIIAAVSIGTHAILFSLQAIIGHIVDLEKKFNKILTQNTRASAYEE